MYNSELKIGLELIRSIDEDQFESRILKRGLVYLILCGGTKVDLQFNPMYSRSLVSGKAFIIYDPDRDLPYRLSISDGCNLCILHTELSTLHSLFVQNMELIPIFNPEYSQRKFYEERELPSEVIQVIHQLTTIKLIDHTKELFLHAKAMEILSLFFGTSKPNVELCPFLNNDEIVRKIKLAKDLLLKNYNTEITLSEVAKQTGLNTYQLKMGFKEIYSNTPYQFVLDYKLELARQMLSKKQLQVNEIADKIGYTNISHFITAFKRKYGVTPKQFMIR